MLIIQNNNHDVKVLLCGNIEKFSVKYAFKKFIIHFRKIINIKIPTKI